MSSRKRGWFFNRGAEPDEAKAVIDENQWRPTSTGNGIYTYGTAYMTYLDIYRTQPAVRQVISFIAENIAQVPIKTYKKISDEDRQILGDHPAQRLFDEPSPSLSRFEFIRDLVTDLELFDVAFYQLGSTADGYVVTRLFPDAVELRDVSATAGPQTFRVYRGNGTYEDLSADKVLFLKGYGGDRGISQMETLRRVLAEDEALGRYREGMYRNGMRNAGVIERPLEAPDWSEKARARFLDQLQDRHTGESGTGRPLLLEEGMSWKSDQITLQSHEYVAQRELTTRVVANAFRISPAILGLTDAPYASITAYNQQLYQNALAPRLEHITQSLERQLLATDERLRQHIYLEFSLDAKLRGSFAEQAQIAQMALGMGTPWMTIDEWRARTDLPPLDEDEKAELLGITAAPNPEGGVQTGAGVTDQPAPSEDAPKRREKAKRPDRGILKRRTAYAEALEKTIGSTFDRAVKSQPHTEYKADRWERELNADLRPELEAITVAEGTRKATELGGDFDRKMVQHYLDAKTENVSRGMSNGVRTVLERHPSGSDEAKTALKSLASMHAMTLATSTMSFAREEAGRQAGGGYKTWRTTTEDSRHADVDGEKVKLDKTFSNGLGYPGDPSGDAEETAGCLCFLDIS